MENLGDRRITAGARRSPAGSQALSLLVPLPLIATAFVVWGALTGPDYSLPDFYVFREAAHAVLAGASPYPPPDSQALAALDKFVYPPVVAFAFTPFALLPYQAGAVLYMALLLASIPLTLAVLRIRDWRCYALAFLFPPVLALLRVGALGSLLALLLAFAWRYRNRPYVAGPLLAIAVVSKLFLWPLLVWLVATRRWRAALIAAGGAAGAAVAAWWVIGFAGLGEYPHLLRALARTLEGDSYTATALGVALGLSHEAARIPTLLLGAVALATTFIVAREAVDGDRRAFTVAIGAALLLSPLVWMHYFVFLLVPLALARPRLSPLWLAPIALWATPGYAANGEGWRIGLALAVLAVVLSICLANGPGQVTSRMMAASNRLLNARRV